MRSVAVVLSCIVAAASLGAASPARAQATPEEKPGASRGPAARAAPDAAESPVHVAQELSQTSVLPGDRFQYRLTITAPIDLKISVEDLDGRGAMFAPFLLLDTVSSTGEQSDSRVYLFEYLLASQEIGNGIVPIPPQVFRYQAASETASDRRISEFRVPAMPVATRSTLNRPVAEATIRPSLPRTFRPRGQASLWATAGAAGLALSAVPLLFGAVRIARRRLQRPRVNRRRARRDASRALQAVAAMSTAEGEQLKQAYLALEQVGRTYVGACWRSVKADALTDADFARVGAAAGVPAAISAGLAAVFANGQKCRYSKQDPEVWRPAFQADLAAVGELLGVRRR
ncbi:MAG: hypothetical protein IT176_09825 [Acidobacteria bacterium]|nr:hypothetical protein [Acidobacteriota bacterium]